jgi:trehalose/maltose hydrolase-like predicted phosphorylase
MRSFIIFPLTTKLEWSDQGDKSCRIFSTHILTRNTYKLSALKMAIKSLRRDRRSCGDNIKINLIKGIYRGRLTAQI